MIKINPLAEKEQKEKGFASYASFPRLLTENGERKIDVITGKPKEIEIYFDFENGCIICETLLNDGGEIKKAIEKKLKYWVKVIPELIEGMQEIDETEAAKKLIKQYQVSKKLLEQKNVAI